jgi:hypothetical protein
MQLSESASFEECKEVVDRKQCENSPYQDFPRSLAGASQTKGDEGHRQPKIFLKGRLV